MEVVAPHSMCVSAQITMLGGSVKHTLVRCALHEMTCGRMAGLELALFRGQVGGEKVALYPLLAHSQKNLKSVYLCNSR